MVLEYCTQRLFTLSMALVWVIIAAASQVAAESWRSLPIDALLAFVLIAQFRIWDDLADRKRDATTHPERVTVRAATLAPFIVACVLLAACGFAIVTLRGPSPGAVAGLAALTLLTPLWYSRRGPRSLLGDHVLLAKYPMFLWIVVVSRDGAPASSLWLAMTAVFLAVCVYEAIHDRTSPGSEQPALLFCEVLALAVTLVACGVRI